MLESNLISAILVPQGAEYQAVCRALSRVSTPTPPVFPIPMGPKPLTQYLEKLLNTSPVFRRQSGVLLMGLCGSLTSSLSVGDVVLYQSCMERLDRATDEINLPSIASTLPLPKNCDRSLTTQIHHQLLPHNPAFVNGLTSDRFVDSAAQKRLLGEIYQADVIDMEGFAALEILNSDLATAMVRVIGDDCDQDLPSLASSLSSDGSLQPLPLAISFIRQPIAAKRLIQGSLRGLRVLQEVTATLFANG